MRYKKKEMTEREEQIFKYGIGIGVLLSAIGFVIGFVIVII